MGEPQWFFWGKGPFAKAARSRIKDERDFVFQAAATNGLVLRYASGEVYVSEIVVE